MNVFHLAYTVSDLDSARSFYGGILGCQEGRSSDSWIDFNFFGHQLVCHLSQSKTIEITNPVDNHDVPVPHFGLVLEWDAFHLLIKELENKKIRFIIEPTIRFKGQIGEQATAFLYDPSGNAIEFKSFKDMKDLFRN